MKYVVTIIIALILIAGFLVWQGVYYPKEPSSLKTVQFLVERGQDAEEIASNLKEAGLIRYSFSFEWYASVSKKADNLKAGEYELSPSMTISGIINKMVSGDMIKRTITIIEGWTLEDIAEYLEVEELDPELEGYLFPDTYELSYDDGIEEMINKMLVNFDKKTKDKFGERPSSDIVIMASLLEKEVRGLEDKKMVAGVLQNRLDIGMSLQVDAAMITYEIKGLPTSPICNPGLESMEAAIYPTKNNYLYYLSTPEGETIFSKTFEEHNIAINKYLR